MNLLFFFFSFVLIFFNSPNAFSEWSHRGRFSLFGTQYSFSKTSDYDNALYGFSGEAALKWKKINWSFLTEMSFQNDFLAKSSPEKWIFDFKNFWIESGKYPVALRVGYQTMFIEGPDLYNPSDVVQPKSWINPTSPETLSSFGVLLNQDLTSWQWQIFYIPIQTQPRLPGGNSPWWPRDKNLPIESENTNLLLPKSVSYQFLNSTELDSATQHNVMAKVNRKSESWEGQVLYFQGLSVDPFITVQASGSLQSLIPVQTLLLDSPVFLKPLYYRHQVWAGYFVVPFNSWILKLAGNWQKPWGSDTRLPSESYATTVGLEKNFETSHGVITAVLQTIEQKKMSQSQISFLKSIFERALACGVRWPVSDESQFFLGGVYDQIGRSSLWRVQFETRWKESWTTEFKIQNLTGPSGTLLGLYDQYDSASLKLSYHW